MHLQVRLSPGCMVVVGAPQPSASGCTFAGAPSPVPPPPPLTGVDGPRGIWLVEGAISTASTHLYKRFVP